jgi:hypothetical protein
MRDDVHVVMTCILVHNSCIEIVRTRCIDLSIYIEGIADLYVQNASPSSVLASTRSPGTFRLITLASSTLPTVVKDASKELYIDFTPVVTVYLAIGGKSRASSINLIIFQHEPHGRGCATSSFEGLVLADQS